MKNNWLIILIFSLLFSCMQPTPRKPIIRKTTTTIEASVLFNKKLNESEEKVFEIIMKSDSLSTYINSSNGFWYKYNVKQNSTYLPKFGDKLYYTYEVFDINNSLIYSFKDVGEKSYVVDQQEIIEGLRNGLKLMKQGEIVTFLFPSHKVYGYIGDQNKINNNQPLIYKVKLNKIDKKNENN